MRMRMRTIIQNKRTMSQLPTMMKLTMGENRMIWKKKNKASFHISTILCPSNQRDFLGLKNMKMTTRMTTKTVERMDTVLTLR